MRVQGLAMLGQGGINSGGDFIPVEGSVAHAIGRIRRICHKRIGSLLGWGLRRD